MLQKYLQSADELEEWILEKIAIADDETWQTDTTTSFRSKLKFHKDFEDDIEAQVPFTGIYNQLVNDYVKSTLIWYSCVEYIPFSSVQFKSNGSIKQQSETGISPSKGETDYLLNKALDNASYYATRLQDYLIANSSNIPEFLQSVGNATQVWPDQSNQYFGGLEL